MYENSEAMNTINDIGVFIFSLIFIFIVGKVIFEVYKAIKEMIVEKNVKHKKQITYKESNYSYLEKRKNWRLTKVVYWTTIVIVSGLLFLPHKYSYDSTIGYGLLVLIASYPGFLLIRRIYIYITG